VCRDESCAKRRHVTSRSSVPCTDRFPYYIGTLGAGLKGPPGELSQNHNGTWDGVQAPRSKDGTARARYARFAVPRDRDHRGPPGGHRRRSAACTTLHRVAHLTHELLEDVLEKNDS